MRKPATDIRLGDGLKGLCNRVDQRVDCPSLRASHSRFDLRPTGLNGMEVWRRGRQGQESCPARREQCFVTCDVVRREIIPEHEVTWLQRWTQDGTAPTAKAVPLESPGDDPWRVKPREASRGEQRIMAPGVVWDLSDHALAGGGPAITAEQRPGHA